MKPFRDAEELELAFQRNFGLMNEHGTVGRTLRDARAPHRFLMTDLCLELNVTAAEQDQEKGGRFLTWRLGLGPVHAPHHHANVERGREPPRARAGDPSVHPLYRRWPQQGGFHHHLA